MGRHKTITDDAILAVAQAVFLAHGHTSPTRQIADAVGISEAVLYQRFGSKDELFFAAMLPPPPDVPALLGPADPPAEARRYLHDVTVRIGRHFAEAIPLGLRVMSHPAFEPSRLGRTPPGGAPSLRDGLAERLDGLVKAKRLGAVPTGTAAKLLISLAHDWALSGAMTPESVGGAGREKALRDLVDLVWDGLRPA